MRSCVIGQMRKPFFVDLRQNFAWTRKTSLNGSEKINRKFHCCGILTSTRLLSTGRGSLQCTRILSESGDLNYLNDLNDLNPVDITTTRRGRHETLFQPHLTL